MPESSNSLVHKPCKLNISLEFVSSKFLVRLLNFPERALDDVVREEENESEASSVVLEESISKKHNLCQKEQNSPEQQRLRKLKKSRVNAPLDATTAGFHAGDFWTGEVGTPSKIVDY